MTCNSKTTIRLMASLIILLMSRMGTSAQEKSGSIRGSYLDLAASGATGRFSGALSWSHLITPDKKLPKLKVGYGVRFTSFAGANKYYVTAPAKFTSPVQSLGTIFSETILENIDTITTATSITNSLNVALYIQYSVTPKIDVGFNIDAIGFSFGTRQKFNIISSVFDPNQSPVIEGSPTAFNLLLTSDNDIGSLNSEFFIRYSPNDKLGLKGGYTFLFSEYQLTEKLSFDNGSIVNDRYRYKASMLLIGLSYKL